MGGGEGVANIIAHMIQDTDQSETMILMHVEVNKLAEVDTSGFFH